MADAEKQRKLRKPNSYLYAIALVANMLLVQKQMERLVHAPLLIVAIPLVRRSKVP